MNPELPDSPKPVEPEASDAEQHHFADAPHPSWMDKLAAVLFCIFCLELGLFLLIYPWLDNLWLSNWFVQWRPEWLPLLASQQFRGGVSGLGVLNLFLGFSEVLRLRRFAGK